MQIFSLLICFRCLILSWLKWGYTTVFHPYLRHSYLCSAVSQVKLSFTWHFPLPLFRRTHEKSINYFERISIGYWFAQCSHFLKINKHDILLWRNKIHKNALRSGMTCEIQFKYLETRFPRPTAHLKICPCDPLRYKFVPSQLQIHSTLFNPEAAETGTWPISAWSAALC